MGVPRPERLVFQLFMGAHPVKALGYGGRRLRTCRDVGEKGTLQTSRQAIYQGKEVRWQDVQ